MAQHNEVRMIGFLLKDATVTSFTPDGHPGRIIFPVRTVHREVDGFPGSKFIDLLVMCDSNQKNLHLMTTLKKDDVINLKGVINIAFAAKKSKCPYCGGINFKENTTITFIYPIFIERRGSYKNITDKEEALYRQFEEISNEVKLIGTVAKDPEMILVSGNNEINDNRKKQCCRYPLGIDRKFYIPSQSELYSDYPWIYTFGQSAIVDYENIKSGMVVFLDGFLQSFPIKSEVICEDCGSKYTFNDTSYNIVPYSVEYMPWSHVPEREEE